MVETGRMFKNVCETTSKQKKKKKSRWNATTDKLYLYIKLKQKVIETSKGQAASNRGINGIEVVFVLMSPREVAVAGLFPAWIPHGSKGGSCVRGPYCKLHIAHYSLLARIISHASAGNAWWEILGFCISKFVFSWPEKGFQHRGSRLTVAGSVKLSEQILWPYGVQRLLRLPVRNLASWSGLVS